MAGWRSGAIAIVTLLLAACGGGGGGGGSSPPPVPDVTITGVATYERVPFSSDVNRGLDYAATSARPIRTAVVELIRSSSGAVFSTATTDTNGAFSLTAPANTSVFVRVKAQSLKAASPTRNIRVLNNTDSNALYALDSAAFTTGTTNQTKDVLAASGWGGSGYTGTRGAAPFAILDTLVTATEFVLANGSPAVDLPPLDVYWSPRNNSAVGDVALGQIGSTLYRSISETGAPRGIYVLGDANTDTDEYDEHVLVHEFQHYLEDAISRTETPSGAHSPDERLDLRLAFSEGFANAFSAIVLNNPLYSDSLGVQQDERFYFNIETETASPAGWYNEVSIQSLVWDLYDTAADGADAVALGYGPLHEALTGPLRTGPALTSIYPFIDYLKGRAGAPVAAINALIAAQRIHVTDEWASNESNDGGVPQALPVYTPVALNAGPVTVCGTTAAGSYNKLGNRLFLRFSLGAAMAVAIRASYVAIGSTAPFSPPPDPDIVLYRNGFLDIAETNTEGEELLSRTLEAGEYVIEVYEWSHIDPSYSAAQRRGNTCFNVSVTG